VPRYGVIAQDHYFAIEIFLQVRADSFRQLFRKLCEFGRIGCNGMAYLLAALSPKHGAHPLSAIYLGLALPR
jgi:hypothetical protein